MASFSKYALSLPPPSVRASKDTAGSLDPGFSSHTTKVCLSSGAATLKIRGTLLLASAATSPTGTAMSSYWTPRSTAPLLPAWTLSSSCWKLLLDPLGSFSPGQSLLSPPTPTPTPAWKRLHLSSSMCFLFSIASTTISQTPGMCLFFLLLLLKHTPLEGRDGTLP